jgi:TolB-like protein
MPWVPGLLVRNWILLESERHAWAESYDCDMSAILATQREAARTIAGCVAKKLHLALS